MKIVNLLGLCLILSLNSCDKHVDRTEGYIRVYVNGIERSYQERLDLQGALDDDLQIRSLYELRSPIDKKGNPDIDLDPWRRKFILFPVRNEKNIFFVIISKGPDGEISDDDVMHTTKEFRFEPRK